MTYAEKLKDPRWQKKRLEILQRSNFCCDKCHRDNLTLHVHHRYYVSRREPWDYPDFCYQSLCEECHDLFDNEVLDSVAIIGKPFFEWEIALDYFGERITDVMRNENISGIPKT